jgi:hypothetical protein
MRVEAHECAERTFMDVTEAFDSDELRGLPSLGLDGKLSVEELLDAGELGLGLWANETCQIRTLWASSRPVQTGCWAHGVLGRPTRLIFPFSFSLSLHFSFLRFPPSVLVSK